MGANESNFSSLGGKIRSTSVTYYPSARLIHSSLLPLSSRNQLIGQDTHARRLYKICSGHNSTPGDWHTPCNGRYRYDQTDAVGTFGRDTLSQATYRSQTINTRLDSPSKSKRSGALQVQKELTNTKAADDSDYSSISSLISPSSSGSSLDAETFIQRIRDKTRRKAKTILKTTKSPCFSPQTSVSSDSTEADFQMALRSLLKSSLKSVDPDAKEASRQGEVKKDILECSEQVRSETTGCESHQLAQKTATRETFGKSLEEEGDCSMETSTSQSLLGFSTGPNGEVSFGAFIRLPQDGPQYLKSFCQRAERPLKGLQSQFGCQIHIAEEPIKYRATNVYHLTIRGATYRNVLRCKNGLPSYLSKLLITSHGTNEDFLRCRPNRRK